MRIFTYSPTITYFLFQNVQSKANCQPSLEILKIDTYIILQLRDAACGMHAVKVKFVSFAFILTVA